MVRAIVIAAAVAAAAALQEQNEWRRSIQRAAPAAEAWTEEDSARARSPHRTPARSKSVLLLVAGLTRHFEETWPKIRASLLEPNEAAGYNFTILVSTSTGIGCIKLCWIGMTRATTQLLNIGVIFIFIINIGMRRVVLVAFFMIIKMVSQVC